MSDERPSPATLAYEPPDPRRRLSRRLARVALIVSAIALLLVARGLYAKFVPALRYHVERYAAQRELLGLATPGVGFDADASHRTSRPPAGATLDRVIARWDRSRLPPGVRMIVNSGESEAIINDRVDDAVYLGPLANSVGEERLVSLRITPSFVNAFPPLERPLGGSSERSTRVAWLAYVRPKRGFWESDGPTFYRLSAGQWIPSPIKLHIEPPGLDPNDRRRLLVHGTADDVPFEYEFVLGANDRLEAFGLTIASPNN